MGRFFTLGYSSGASADSPQLATPEDIYGLDLVDWWDPSQGKTTTGTGVSSWVGRVNGEDAAQGTDANRPTDSTGYLTFEGSDWLDTDFAAISQPNSIFMHVYLTTLAATEVFIDGKNTNRNQMASQSTGRAQAYAGNVVTSASAGVFTTGQWYYITGLFNGSSSVMRVDGSEVISSDAGALGLQARFGSDTGSTRLNGRIGHVVIVDALASAQEITDTEAWFAANVPS